MTKDQIDDLMRENGIVVVGEAVYALCQIVYEAGRKDENEACEQVCEDLPADEFVDRSDATIWDVATLECAAAIRARREQQ